MYCKRRIAVRSRDEAEKLLEAVCPVLLKFRERRQRRDTEKATSEAETVRRYIRNRMAAHFANERAIAGDGPLSEAKRLFAHELPNLEDYRAEYRTAASSSDRNDVLERYVRFLFSGNGKHASASATGPSADTSTSSSSSSSEKPSASETL